jgi:hypothetical protein
MAVKISTDQERKIINDFAKEIDRKKLRGAKPENAVIEFRNDRKSGIERPIYLVPVKLLRFRKDNGRIASDVLSYEKLHGILDETLESTQDVIRKFLKEKDEENNVKLKNSILHSEQKEPAIITCDGFLINGNRRKMILEELNFETMKVVILPGENEERGPPTIKEIEQIENRYQLHSDGKSEYTNFDRAISIKRKIEAGISLEEQLRDDPSFVNTTDKELKRIVQKYQEEYLGPLECIDRYLEQLDRGELYDTISEGRADKEGRWYSFIEYYKLYRQLNDDKKRVEIGVEEDEVGDIENVAFKLIRKKDFPKFKKTHEVIRGIPQILKDRNAKKELLKIKSNTIALRKDDYNEDDDIKTVDKKWGSKNESIIIGTVKRAYQIIEHEKEIETPLSLLEGALKKLNHDSMIPEAIDVFKLDEAIDKTQEIQSRAADLEKEFDHLRQKFQKLRKKNDNRLY